jgi:hypothetical protein
VNGSHKSRARHVYKVSVQVKSNLDEGGTKHAIGFNLG